MLCVNVAYTDSSMLTQYQHSTTHWFTLYIRALVNPPNYLNIITKCYWPRQPFNLSPNWSVIDRCPWKLTMCHHRWKSHLKITAWQGMFKGSLTNCLWQPGGPCIKPVRRRKCSRQWVNVHAPSVMLWVIFFFFEWLVHMSYNIRRSIPERFKENLNI